jgi:hypothetical protein
LRASDGIGQVVLLHFETVSILQQISFVAQVMTS